MKKSVSSFLAGILSLLVLPTLLASPAQAADGTIACSGGGTFTVVGTQITGSTADCAGEITIPADVVNFSNGAFRDRALTSVLFAPNSQLKEVSNSVFYGTLLTSIDLPDGLERLGRDSFAYSKLTSITIPGTVREFETFALQNVTNLETVIFEPASPGIDYLFLGVGPFSGSRKLTSITWMGPRNFDDIYAREFGKNNRRDINEADRPANTWLGWSDSVGGPILSFPQSFSNGKTFYTNYAPKSFPADFRYEGGTAPGPSSMNIVGGYFDQPVPVPTRRGYDFLDYDGIPNLQEEGFWGEREMIFRARWAPKTNVVTFNSNGGSPVGNGSYVTEGRRATAPETPTRAGYTFMWWSEVDGGGGVSGGFPYYPNELPVGDVTLYARWSANTYTVTFNSEGGSSVGDDSYVTDGRKAAEPQTPTRAGYTFSSWSATDGGSAVTFPYAPIAPGNTTLYANWTPNPFTVNLDSKGGSPVPAVSFVTDGAISTAPAAPAREDHAFLGWSATDGGSVLTFPYSPGVTEEITLYAKWRKLTPEIAAGTTPNSRVATLPEGLLDATVPATATVPRIRFVLPEMDGDVVATIAPIKNPAIPAKTPFIVTGLTKIVDISVTGIVGNVTVCLDGGPTDHLYHYTGGAWVSIPEHTYANGQVCAVTSSFSPFTAATPAPFKPRLKGSPIISGNARQNTLVATTPGTWSALPTAAASFQWYRCDKKATAGRATLTTAMNCTKIARATKSNYKVGLADQGKYLTVLTQAKNKMGSTFSTAKSVLVPKATVPAMKSAPKISGSAVKGMVVTLGAGTWTANPTPTTTQQWYRCENAVSVGLSEFTEAQNCVKIPGASKTTYKVGAADQGTHITALVIGKNSQGALVKSAKSVKVPGIKPAAKVSPKISGKAVSGSALRTSSGTWSGIPAATTSLAWYRCSKSVPAAATSIPRSSGCKKISGATGSNYTVGRADQGKYLTVLVNAKNTEGQASSTAASVFVKVPVVTPQQ